MDRTTPAVTIQGRRIRESGPPALGDLLALAFLFELVAFGVATVKSEQALGKFGRARETACRVAAGGCGNVLPNQGVFDPGFPSRRDCLAKIADRELVEH